MAFYRSELKSFDFVELDEESISQIKRSNSLETIPMLTPKLHEAVFIRSTSPVDISKDSACREIVISSSNSRVIFDPNASYIEGRDSMLFCADLISDDGMNSRKVAVKVYRSDTDSLAGAAKEKVIAELTDGEAGFAKAYHFDADISIWDWMSLGSLDKCLPKLPESSIDRIIVRIAKCILFLHKHSITHQDIKPHNILISQSGDAALIDFGDAKLNCPTSLPLDEGIGLGTLAYTAPELLSRKSEAYNPYAADVYSFGVTAFYILHRGKINPWAAFGPARAVQLILYVQKGFFAGGFNPPLSQSHPFSNLIEQCLSLDPEQRPTIDQVVSALDRVQ